MKRFYCEICKKIKRVRKYPRNIQNEFDTVPEYRKGTCARHSMGFTSSKSIQTRKRA